MTTRTVEDRLKALADKGWTLHLYFGWEGWDFTGAYAGDCNCPHPKEFDPSDGHGYSTLDERDIPVDDIPNWTPLEWWLDKLEPRIAAIVPGAPYPAKPKPEAPKKRRFWNLFK